MSLRNFSPVIYGGISGVVASCVGIVQVIASVRDFEARSIAFDKRFPPGYTGFRDATNLVRGGEFNFVGTGLEALGIIAVLMVITSTLAVVATHKPSAAVMTTLIAGAISIVFYVTANVMAVSTGFHPMAPYQDGWRDSLPGCFAVCLLVMFVLAWITGLIGAGLGSLMERVFPPTEPQRTPTH